MKTDLLKLLALLLVAVLVVGCSGVDTKETGEGATVDELAGQEGASTMGAEGRGEWTGNPLDNPDSPLYTRVIYFDYDSSDIRSDYLGVLRAHAAYLAANPGVQVVLQGHTDERGTREYNLALGERRALSVRRFIMAEGVAANQLDFVSYGEESPADSGHNENAWSMNRRVEIVY